MIYLSFREISIIIWFLIFTLYIYSNSRFIKVRSEIAKVIKTFLSKHIIFSLIQFILYSLVVLLFLFKLKLWSFDLFKDSIIWIFSVWIYILWNYNKIHNKEELKGFIFGNFKLLAIIQLVIGLYSCAFIFELIIIPILLFSSFTIAISELYIEFKAIKPFLEKIITFFSVLMLINSAIMIYVDRVSFFTLNNIYHLFFTSLLNLLSLPFIIYTVLYISYEQTFISLHRIVKRKSERVFLMIFIMIKFNFKFKLLNYWSSSIFLLDGKSVKVIKNHIIDTINEYKKDNQAMKKNHKDKFCPYKAKIFLSSEGIFNEKYKCINSSWVSNSNYLEIGNSLVKSYIRYEIYKNENSLEKLVLTLDIMDISDKDIAHKKLIRCISIIFKNLFNKDIDFNLRKILSDNCEINTYYYNINLTAKKEVWPNHQYNGYDVVVKLEFV